MLYTLHFNTTQYFTIFIVYTELYVTQSNLQFLTHGKSQVA